MTSVIRLMILTGLILFVGLLSFVIGILFLVSSMGHFKAVRLKNQGQDNSNKNSKWQTIGTEGRTFVISMLLLATGVLLLKLVFPLVLDLLTYKTSVIQANCVVKEIDWYTDLVQCHQLGDKLKAQIGGYTPLALSRYTQTPVEVVYLKRSKVVVDVKFKEFPKVQVPNTPPENLVYLDNDHNIVPCLLVSFSSVRRGRVITGVYCYDPSADNLEHYYKFDRLVGVWLNKRAQRLTKCPGTVVYLPIRKDNGKVDTKALIELVQDLKCD